MTMRVLLLALLVAAQGAVAQSTFHGNNARTGVYDSAPSNLAGLSGNSRPAGRSWLPQPLLMA